jgi:hypothetical protein
MRKILEQYIFMLFYEYAFAVIYVWNFNTMVDFYK